MMCRGPTGLRRISIISISTFQNLRKAQPSLDIFSVFPSPHDPQDRLEHDRSARCIGMSWLSFVVTARSGCHERIEGNNSYKYFHFI